MKTYKETKNYQNLIAKRELKAERERLDKTKTHEEKTVDKWFCRAVEEAGGITFKMHPMTDSGIPDRLVHVKGMTFYVEFKGTGKTCSPIQIEMHEKIHKHGVPVYVLDTKITNFYDFFTSCYTTYESKHYRKNPHKDKNV